MRPRVLDYMQNYPFWLFDVPDSEGSMIRPSLGFSSMTAPEISVEQVDIQPGNFEYKTSFVKTADVGAITFQRGVRFFDSDFYDWIVKAVNGNRRSRRNVVLVHFMTYGTTIRQLNTAVRVPGKMWVLPGCIPIRYKAASDFDASSADVSIAELEIKPMYMKEVSSGNLLINVEAFAGFSAGVDVSLDLVQR